MWKRTKSLGGLPTLRVAHAKDVKRDEIVTAEGEMILRLTGRVSSFSLLGSRAF